MSCTNICKSIMSIKLLNLYCVKICISTLDEFTLKYYTAEKYQKMHIIISTLE
jgi:hypothetical protein